jgi:DNA-binding response OmpR family regulator
MDNSTVLVVEDQASLRILLVESVLSAGYMVHDTGSVESAISILKRETINVILLDLELEDGNGLEILRFVRRQNNSIAVLIISNYSSLKIRISSFKEGTDDFILKPFCIEEVIARVHRAFQRSKELISSTAPVTSNLQVGDLTLDYQNVTVETGTDIVPLRKGLFYLLEYFMKNEGTVMNKRVIFAALWQDQSSFDENTLSVHIHQLRKIIDPPDDSCSHIETIRGIGYRFLGRN